MPALAAPMIKKVGSVMRCFPRPFGVGMDTSLRDFERSVRLQTSTRLVRPNVCATRMGNNRLKSRKDSKRALGSCADRASIRSVPA